MTSLSRLRALPALLVCVAVAPTEADALIPPADDGIVVHVTFDGHGHTLLGPVLIPANLDYLTLVGQP